MSGAVVKRSHTRQPTLVRQLQLFNAAAPRLCLYGASVDESTIDAGRAKHALVALHFLVLFAEG